MLYFHVWDDLFVDKLIVGNTGAALRDNNEASAKVTTQYGRR